ncbi:MAG: radical SAM protein, partial [Nitrospinota bacterium]
LSTFLANFETPDADYLERVYRKVTRMMNEKGLSSEKSSSGCVKCKACSMQQFLENHPRGEENE